MKLSRIEACAFIKSAIEAGIKSDHWLGVLERAAEAMEAVAGPVPPPSASAPRPSAPSPAGGRVSLVVVSTEDHGKRVRIEATGYANGKYFTAWDKNASAARSLAPGDEFTAEVVEKPNPKSKYPHLNLEDIKVSVGDLSEVPTGGDAPDDLPF